MPEKKSTRGIGFQMEEKAVSYLQKNGMKLLERNFHSRCGEIDIIGYHEGCLVFIEVKYRRTQKYGLPESAVTPAKQKKICKAADYYRYIHHYSGDTAFRYDVVAILGEEIRWYRNAFEHKGY